MEEEYNEIDVRSTYQFLAHTNQTEIRLLSPTREMPPRSIFVNNEEDFVAECKKYSGKFNVYVGIHERRDQGTTSRDAVSVKSIILDVDALRSNGNPKDATTNQELKLAEEVADKIIKDSAGNGVKPPVKNMSGNGYQLWFAIPEIKINDSNRTQVESKIKNFIDSIKSKYETESVRIDQIGDLARIIKVIGTKSIKGNNTTERPYRISESCTDFKRVEDEALKELILNLPKKELNEVNEFSRKVELGYWEILKKHDATEQERCSCVMQIHHAHKSWGLEEAFDYVTQHNNWQDFNPDFTHQKMKEVWDRYADEITKLQKTNTFKETVLELLQKNRPEATELLAKAFEKDYHVRTIRDDKYCESWAYSDGIYVPHAKSYAKEFVRENLGKAFTTHLCNDVISKIEADTLEDMDNFFNQDNPEEIAVLNGILNILTGELSEFTPDKIFFNKIPVNYDPSKDCPNINKFFNQVLNEDADSIKAMEEMFGYLLFKKYKIEKAVMFMGDGRNGKSKTLELMKRFIGPENCSGIPLQDFETSQFSKIELHKKLANLSGDIDETTVKKTGAFKQLTGGDIISAPRKFLPMVHFVNYAKLIFATNKLPRTKDTSLAFFNRWVLFNFPITFLSQEEYNALPEASRGNVQLRDPSIIEKVSNPDELSGLLNLALAGLKRLLQNKDFTKSMSVKDVETTWISKSDSFLAFARDHIEECLSSTVLKKDLRHEYMNFCKKNKLQVLSEKIMKESLMDAFSVCDGYEETPFNPKATWEGIKLK